ncbi:hypothetical protein I5907_19315 [Panacibacter sp. DH6]|uniref:DUF4430 domain-containing protein n=1 Tax=Panacibacter microcysteis TaxID=2793269 RepID=A0A931MCZ9_9BACT|nr:hypothetical protein [Panacibacter microcysteis]MBG9378396.1 hypothetical protein [Panacibacter microcysteis]
MRPSLLLVTWTILVCSCSDTGQEKVESADTLKTDLSNTKSLDTTSKVDSNNTNKATLTLDTLPNISLGKMTLVSSGQMSPYTTIKIDGCDFDLVTNDSDTTYLATNDKKFQTPEGYKVGTRFTELPIEIQTELTKEPDWGYYFKLLSGWTLGFCEGNSCTDKYPENGSKVKWIFKRR